MRIIDADKLITDMNNRAEEEYLEFRDIRNMVQFALTVKAIPLDKIKQIREEINAEYKEAEFMEEYKNGRNDGLYVALRILDKLITESEGKYE